MNRLTKKIKGSNNYCKFELKNAKYKDLFELSSNREIENYVNTDLTIAIDKLGQLEDIEEELGIDLLTLLKVWEAVITRDYFWVKYNNELAKTDDIEIGDYKNGLLFIYFYWSNGKHLVLHLKDYGKTYALTKRELEQNE